MQCSTCASHEPWNGEAEGAKHKGGLAQRLFEYQKSLQRVQLSAGSKLEAMRAEEAVGNNKGGQEEIWVSKVPPEGACFKSLVQVVFGHGVLGAVTTKRVIDYYYQSRLPSARQVQDMFIIVAAISVKHVRRWRGDKEVPSSHSAPFSFLWEITPPAGELKIKREKRKMRQSVKKSRSKCQNKEIMNKNNQFLNF